MASGTLAVMVRSPSAVLQVAAAAEERVRAPAEVDQVEPRLAVKVRAWEAPATTESAPPAGPVMLAAPSASTKVRSPTEEIWRGSVPSPISSFEEGELPPMPRFPPALILIIPARVLAVLLEDATGAVRKTRAPDPPVPVPVEASMVKLAPATSVPAAAAPRIVVAVGVPPSPAP